MTVTDGLAAVLFDMDGLLVDTEPLWFETEIDVMARLGATWTKQDQAVLLGGSMERTVAYLLAKATKPASPAEVERWMLDGMLRRAEAGRVTVLPGARELLAEVAAAGLPYALVTSSQRAVRRRRARGHRIPVPGDRLRRGRARHQARPRPLPARRQAARRRARPLRGPGGLAQRRRLRHRGRLPWWSRCRRSWPSRPPRAASSSASLRDVTLATLRALAG